MNIAIVSSEVVPFAKTGGLADVSGALGKYLSLEDCDVRIFTPLYDITVGVEEEMHHVDFVRDVSLWFGSMRLDFSLVTAPYPDSNAHVYFVDAPSLFHRGSVYTEDRDEFLRFALLCRATLESCQRMGWEPDVIHCNDWQSALIPLFLKSTYAWDDLFSDTQTVLTIHNLAYQGAFRSSVVNSLGFGFDYSHVHQDDLRAGVFNFLKHGIMYADVLTTVSETYAHEIQTAEFGEGLEDLLRTRGDRLVGIVNGVDYHVWNPETDELLEHHYNGSDTGGKEENKRYLLDRMDLPYAEGVPVFGMVSRLVTQKGLDLFPDLLESWLDRVDMRLVVLGSGEERYEKYFERLQEAYPESVCFYRGYSNELAHLIEAGADIFLMPSKYEPCGLNQIYSLRYGTVPIVRRTGGLADTVRQFDPESGEGNGFVFDHFTKDGLGWAIEQALELWSDRPRWELIMKNGMAANWSWEHQIQRYLELYESLVSHPS